MLFFSPIISNNSLKHGTGIQAMTWTQSKLQTSVQIDEHSLRVVEGCYDPWMINWWNPKIHEIPANSHMGIGINFEVYPTCREHWIGNMKSFTRINGTLATTTTTPTQNGASILARSGVQGLTGIVTNCVFTSKSHDKRNTGLDWQTSAPAKSERGTPMSRSAFWIIGPSWILSKVPNTHEQLQMTNLTAPKACHTPTYLHWFSLVWPDLPRIKKHRGFKAQEHGTSQRICTTKQNNKQHIYNIYNRYKCNIYHIHTWRNNRHVWYIYSYTVFFWRNWKKAPQGPPCVWIPTR